MDPEDMGFARPLLAAVILAGMYAAGSHTTANADVALSDADYLLKKCLSGEDVAKEPTDASA